MSYDVVEREREREGERERGERENTLCVIVEKCRCFILCYCIAKKEGVVVVAKDGIFFLHSNNSSHTHL